MWMLLLADDSARHMRKVRLTSSGKRKQAPELLCLLGGFLVRVRVLLQTLDAVLHLRPPETCEEDASVVTRYVHHRRVKSKVTVLCQYTRLHDNDFKRNKVTN
jgi:hypothetical protein